MFHHLGEDRSANMHAPLSGLQTVPSPAPRGPKRARKSSNRKIWKWHLTIDVASTCSRCAGAQPDTSEVNLMPELTLLWSNVSRSCCCRICPEVNTEREQ